MTNSIRLAIETNYADTRMRIEQCDDDFVFCKITEVSLAYGDLHEVRVNVEQLANAVASLEHWRHRCKNDFTD